MMMNKLLLCSLLALLSAVSSAFSPPCTAGRRGTTFLSATTSDRRNFCQSIAIGSAATLLVATPQAALAKEYVPKFDDVKIILVLGTSLDRLIAKMQDPDKASAALEGLGAFNRDPNFYPLYAQNFISKTVKKRADEDVRVGYMKQACKLIGSTETLMEESLVDKDAAGEAVKRIQKAQQLIAKFLAESGVEDDNIKTYVSQHAS